MIIYRNYRGDPKASVRIMKKYVFKLPDLYYIEGTGRHGRKVHWELHLRDRLRKRYHFACLDVTRGFTYLGPADG